MSILKTVKFHLALLAIVAPYLAFAQADSAKAPKDWLKYSDTDYYISFPKSLDVNFDGVAGMRIQMLTKKESNVDMFLENFNLISEVNLNPDTKLEHYIDASLEQLAIEISGFKLIESVSAKMSGLDCHKIVFEGQYGTMNLKWEQYIFLYHGRAYIWTLTSELGKFDDIKPLFEKVVNTFILKD